MGITVDWDGSRGGKAVGVQWKRQELERWRTGCQVCWVVGVEWDGWERMLQAIMLITDATPAGAPPADTTHTCVHTGRALMEFTTITCTRVKGNKYTDALPPLHTHPAGPRLLRVIKAPMDFATIPCNDIQRKAT